MTNGGTHKNNNDNNNNLDGGVDSPVVLLDQISGDEEAGPVEAVGAVDPDVQQRVLRDEVGDDLDKGPRLIFVRRLAPPFAVYFHVFHLLFRQSLGIVPAGRVGQVDDQTWMGKRKG